MPKKSKEKLKNEEIIEKKKTTTPKTSKVKASVATSKSSGNAKKTVNLVSQTKVSSSVKKATVKKATVKKSPSKKSSIKDTSKKVSNKAKVSVKVNSKSNSLKKVTPLKRPVRKLRNQYKLLQNKSYKKLQLPFIVEYYDLPYKYNKTVIKVLAQNPNTLFVYWEISDEDINNLKNQFGENFFNVTKPVLIVHNLSEKYSFEIDINDFANNWYIHVNDTKSQYVVELGRRPKEGFMDNLQDNYLYITSSNMIESPNDHVLFYDSIHLQELLFKNIKTNEYTRKVIKPFLKHIYTIYGSLHFDKVNNHFDFKNPSSQNPTSNVF